MARRGVVGGEVGFGNTFKITSWILYLMGP